MAPIIASIKTEIYHMYLTEEGMVCLDPEFKEDQLDVTKELVDELLDNALKLTNNTPYLLLFNFKGKYVNMPKEVASYVYDTPKFSEYKIAEAIVTSSFASKLAINFYLTVLKPPKPAKLFTSKEKAISWLLKHK